MQYQSGQLLYEGKAKKVFEVLGHKDLALFYFKDSLTAFNAQKKGQFVGKGRVNAQIASGVFRFLKKSGVRTHWVADLSPEQMVVRRLKMLPLEVVVRNRVAGSLAKKLGREEGEKLRRPLVEFYFKDDALADPFVSDDQILAFRWLKSQAQINTLKREALKINQALRKYFAKANLDLIDFKVEFGRERTGKLLLADEITPDSCRLWDKNSGERMDKDRFRRDLGQVQESYEEVLRRLSDLQSPQDKTKKEQR